jgi:hypothetical protein
MRFVHYDFVRFDFIVLSRKTAGDNITQYSRGIYYECYFLIGVASYQSFYRCQQ